MVMGVSRSRPEPSRTRRRSRVRQTPLKSAAKARRQRSPNHLASALVGSGGLGGNDRRGAFEANGAEIDLALEDIDAVNFDGQLVADLDDVAGTLADEAFALGGQTSAESYLDFSKLLDAAASAGDALIVLTAHPADMEAVDPAMPVVGGCTVKRVPISTAAELPMPTFIGTALNNMKLKP